MSQVKISGLFLELWKPSVWLRAEWRAFEPSAAETGIQEWVTALSHLSLPPSLLWHDTPMSDVHQLPLWLHSILLHSTLKSLVKNLEAQQKRSLFKPKRHKWQSFLSLKPLYGHTSDTSLVLTRKLFMNAVITGSLSEQCFTLMLCLDETNQTHQRINMFCINKSSL